MIPQLSVIIPFQNEADNLLKLHKEIVDCLQKINLKSEIIYVDDGSTDGFSSKLTILTKQKNRKKINGKLIVLRRNFGQTAALSAGISHARGQIIAFLDGDLQNDPMDLLKMLPKINNDCDGVMGWRKNRKDKFLRVYLSKAANLLMKKIFGLPFHDLGCSIKIIKKEILKNIEFYGESHRILPALLYWKGARFVEMPVNHRQRQGGKSKYGYSRIFKLVIEVITIKFLNSYATKPAYIFGAAGILSFFLAFLALLAVAYEKIFREIFVHRNPLFLIAIFLILVGVQFILMGLLAEMMSRIYFESKERDPYEIKRISSF